MENARTIARNCEDAVNQVRPARNRVTAALHDDDVETRLAAMEKNFQRLIAAPEAPNNVRPAPSGSSPTPEKTTAPRTKKDFSNYRATAAASWATSSATARPRRAPAGDPRWVVGKRVSGTEGPSGSVATSSQVQPDPTAPASPLDTTPQPSEGSPTVRHSAMTAPVILGEALRIRALIDTGSCKSLVRRETLQRALGREPELSPDSEPPTFDVNGRKVPILGKSNAPAHRRQLYARDLVRRSRPVAMRGDHRQLTAWKLWRLPST